MRRSLGLFALFATSMFVVRDAAALAPAPLAYGGTVLASETEKLTAQAPADNDRFSESVAISGDTTLVGMPGADVVGSGSGSAVVYARSGASWVQQAVLTSLDLASGDQLGQAVAVDGDRAVVTALADDDPVSFAGSAYVFERSGTVWSQTAKLTAAVPVVNNFLGFAVDLDGDTIAVTATGGASNAGSVYVFVYDGTDWSEEAILTASDWLSNDGFGAGVGLDGNTIVVGAPENDSLQGSAYVYERSGTVWTEVQNLLASDADLFNRFGASVDVSGDRIVAGSPGYVHGAGNVRGAGYVFAKSGTTWTEEQRLDGNDAEINDRQGAAVAIEGDRVLVGAFGDTHTAANEGSAYVWVRQNGAWFEGTKLIASDHALLDLFGHQLALSGRRAVVGAINDDDGADNAGSAYVFDLVVSKSFCDAADGSHAACPCVNPGSPDAGCDIAQGTGGVELEVTGQEVAVMNRATLTGTGFPVAGAPTAIVIRAAGLDASGPVVFGDGLRCIDVPLVRLGAAFASGGVSTHTFGHGSAAGAGQFSYQLWFRNTPIMYCDPSAAFNLSNGRTLTWP